MSFSEQFPIFVIYFLFFFRLAENMSFCIFVMTFVRLVTRSWHYLLIRWTLVANHHVGSSAPKYTFVWWFLIYFGFKTIWVDHKNSLTGKQELNSHKNINNNILMFFIYDFSNILIYLFWVVEVTFLSFW